MERTPPDYSAHDLAQIHVPIAIVQSDHDEFIKPEHADYLAPLQRPAQFNHAVLDFLRRTLP